VLVIGRSHFAGRLSTIKQFLQLGVVGFSLLQSGFVAFVSVCIQLPQYCHSPCISVYFSINSRILTSLRRRAFCPSGKGSLALSVSRGASALGLSEGSCG